MAMKKLLLIISTVIAIALVSLFFLFSRQESLESKVKDVIKSSEAESVAVYSYDLTRKQSFGINEDTDFVAASLYKVPLMMALLKRIEEQPILAKQEFQRTDEIDQNSTQYYTPAKVMPLHEPQNVDQLLNYIIGYSDNFASLLLSAYIGTNDLRKVFTSVGLEFNVEDKIISPKNYSKFFIALYNNAYVNQELSEGAIQVLTNTDFKQGLVAGIPENIVVAHKFGALGKQRENPSLHDCGIVYTKNPYIICVMTRGKEYQELEKLIQNISTLIYENNIRY